jgi:hypothetical protein
VKVGVTGDGEELGARVLAVLTRHARRRDIEFAGERSERFASGAPLAGWCAHVDLEHTLTKRHASDARTGVNANGEANGDVPGGIGWAR